MLDTRLVCSTEKVKWFAVPKTCKDTKYKYIRTAPHKDTNHKYIRYKYISRSAKRKSQSKLSPEVHNLPNLIDLGYQDLT